MAVPTSQGNATASEVRERFPAPPKDLLSILRTFVETQERRVNLWKEYDEVMEGHLKALIDEKNNGPSQEGAVASDPSTTNINGSQTGASADASHPHSHSAHADSPGLPLSDPSLLTRVIGLVTSGLLDCAHETRTIALELASPTTCTTPREDLSRLVGQVQDGENEVLRKVVRRDQLRRMASIDNTDEQDEAGDSSEEVEKLRVEIEQVRRGKIQELLGELRAEMTDLELGED